MKKLLLIPLFALATLFACCDDDPIGQTPEFDHYVILGTKVYELNAPYSYHFSGNELSYIAFYNHFSNDSTIYMTAWFSPDLIGETFDMTHGNGVSCGCLSLGTTDEFFITDENGTEYGYLDILARIESNLEVSTSFTEGTLKVNKADGIYTVEFEGTLKKGAHFKYHTFFKESDIVILKK